ncbi:MAG TPA: hypothetical protein VIF57_11195 [Polyangia bacterium]|jgi:hypothetical protein
MTPVQMASRGAAAVMTADHATRVFQRGGQTVRAALLTRFGAGDVEYQADLAYGFPARDAMPALLDAGFRKLGEMRRFALALRTGSFLRDKLGTAAGSVVSTGLDALRSAGLLARAGRAAIEYSLEMPAQVDERFDHLWEAAQDDFPFVGVRDAAFVGRRFAGAAGGGGVALAALAHRKTGALTGYAALARDGDDANLVDVFATRQGLAPLLRLCAVRAARDGVQALSIRLAGAPALVTCLTLLGFREQEDAAPVIVGLGAGQDPRGELTDADTWYLTEADADL